MIFFSSKELAKSANQLLKAVRIKQDVVRPVELDNGV